MLLIKYKYASASLFTLNSSLDSALDEFKAETIDQYKQDVERMIAILTAIK